MRILTAGDALAPRVERVSALSRPGGARPGVVYAVFGPAEEGEGPFLGLVTTEALARFPGRIFADLLPDPPPEPVSAEAPLAVVARRLGESGGPLPVLRRGRFLGAVTRESLLAALLRQERSLVHHLEETRQALAEDRNRFARLCQRLQALNAGSARLVGRLVSRAGLRRLLHEAAAGLPEVVPARFAAVLLRQGPGGGPVLMASGLRPGELKELRRWAGALLEGPDPPPPEPSRDPWGHPCLCLDIRHRRRALGWLVAGREAGAPPFDAEDLALAEAFAQGLAALLLNLEERERRRRAEEDTRRLLEENRRLNRYLLTALEEERRSIARELHDELGQCATALRAEMMVVRSLAGPRESRLREAARAGMELAQRLYEVTHAMIQRLRPGLLEEVGLEAAVQHYAGLWRRRHPGVRCRLLVRGTLEGLDEEGELALYRAVQEGLTNVSRHARARRVVIRLRRLEGPQNQSLELIIKDDGVGLRGQPQGLGLIGLRERLEALGGCLSVEDARRGTCLRVLLPLRTKGTRHRDPPHPHPAHR